QAEDGIRAFHVTGVQTCALPIYGGKRPGAVGGFRQSAQGRGAQYRADRRNAGRKGSCQPAGGLTARLPCDFKERAALGRPFSFEIGRASCRERVSCWGTVVALLE